MAKHLGTRDYHVIIHYHQSKQSAHTLATSLQQNGHRATLLQADLSNITQVTQIVPSLYASHGRLDWIIHNASSFLPSTLWNLNKN